MEVDLTPVLLLTYSQQVEEALLVGNQEALPEPMVEMVEMANQALLQGFHQIEPAEAAADQQATG